jgi:hypothetical protein
MRRGLPQGNVLIVDDELEVLSTCGEVLREACYEGALAPALQTARCRAGYLLTF